MLGTKLYKDKLDKEDYTSTSYWCMSNNATIVDKGDYYECVVIPPLPLENLKKNKLVALKATRDSLEVAPLNNFDVDSKSLSRIDIASKILATGAIPNIEWTMADNTVKAITSADFTALYVALATRSNELHEKYRNLKEQVQACTDEKELEAIVFE